MTTIIRHTHCVLHSHLAVTHPTEGDEGEGGEGRVLARPMLIHCLTWKRQVGELKTGEQVFSLVVVP